MPVSTHIKLKVNYNGHTHRRRNTGEVVYDMTVLDNHRQPAHIDRHRLTSINLCGPARTKKHNNSPLMTPAEHWAISGTSIQIMEPLKLSTTDRHL